MSAPDFGAIAWLLRSVVSERHLEPVLGDLEEEYGMVAASRPPAAAAAWYWSQVCRSVVPLAWSTLRRRGWPTTFGLALVLYIAWGLVEALVSRFLLVLLTPDALSSVVWTFVVGLTAAVFIGYVAAWLRAGTPLALAILVFVTIAVMIVMKVGSEPWWYGLTWLVAGPFAVLAGGTLRRSARSSSALTSS